MAEHRLSAWSQGECADDIDHVGERLMLGEHLKPAGHRGDGYVGARDEREREHDHAHALCRLSAAGEHAHRDEQPYEGETEGDDQPKRGKAVERAPLEAESDGESDRRGDAQAVGEDRGVGDRPRCEH